VAQMQISARIRDAWGTETSTLIYGEMDDTEDLTSVEALAQTVIGALDGCTDGVITEAHITLPIVPTGVKATAGTGARVEQTGLLGFSATGTTKKYSLAIPAVSNAGTVLNVDRIVLSVGSPMNVLTTYLLNPAGNMTFRGDNEKGQALTDLVDAELGFRKRRKQLQRSSFERA